MQRLEVMAAALVAAMLAGCGRSDPGPGGIPVSQVISSIKCELANYLIAEKARSSEKFKFAGEIFGLQLGLKITNANSAKVGGTFQPVIVPLQATGSFGASFSTEKTEIKETVLTFYMSSTVADNSACQKAAAAGIPVHSIGFREYLESTAAEIDKGVSGRPFIVPDKFKYATSFGVKRTTSATAGVSFVIVPVTISAEAAQSREDIQSLVIWANVNQYPEWKKIAKPTQ